MKPIGVVLWVGLLLAGARLGWIWLERHDGSLRREAASQAKRGQGRRDPWDDDTGELKITQFYARSGVMTAGDPNLVCYGVRNAKRVRIEPPVESLSPAWNRCFFVDAQRDTTYTLIAEGAGGRQVSESFTVRVRPARPAIVMFATSERRIPRGEAITMCYGVAHASAAKVEPGNWPLPPVARNCTRFYPMATGTYTLIATGDGGTDRRAFSVTVR